MRLSPIAQLSVALLCFALIPFSLPAQNNPNFEIGLKPFGSYQMGNIDFVDLATGALGVDIPLISYPQRGGKLRLDFALHYFNAAYYSQYYCYTQYCGWVWFPLPSGMAVIDKQQVSTSFTPPAGNVQGVLTVIGADGASHPLAPTGNNLLETIDASGYLATGGGVSYPLKSVVDKDGVTYVPTGESSGEATCSIGFVGYSIYDGHGSASPYACTGPRSDPNGNQITFPLSYPENGWTDTMGRFIPVPTESTNQSDFSGCTGSQPIVAALLWNPPGINGGTYPLKFCYFAENTTSQRGYNQYELQSVVLPNGTAWTFQYTPSTGSLLPSISQITFPTGGTLSYTWETTQACAAGNGSLNGNYSVVTRTLNPNDGITPASTWTYSYTTNGTYPFQTIVSAPPSNGSTPDDTVHTIGLGSSPACVLYETKTQKYQGSHTNGTLLETTSTTYQYSTTPTCLNFCNLVPLNVTDAWANGETTETSWTYDNGFQFYQTLSVGVNSSPVNTSGSGSLYSATYGLKLTQRDYDYGNGAAGSLLRTTTNNYLALSNSSYQSANLLDLRSSMQVTDSGGTQRGYTTYAYDETGSPQGVHGNLTSTHRWLNTTGTYLVSSSVYNSNGLVTSSSDPKGNPTTYGYSGTCYAGSGPVSVANALSQTTHYCYDFNTGLLTSVEDPNLQTTSYGYDEMLRTTQITDPDTGGATFTYPNPNEVEIAEKITASTNKVAYLLVDGIGRQIRKAVTNGESLPYDEADTCYDGLGHVNFKSYPFQDSGPFATSRSCASPEAGDALAYDALGRPTSVTHSDTSSILTSYAGRATSVQDEGNGTQRVQRMSQVDGLGRMVSACEVTGTALTVGISGSTTPVACTQEFPGYGFLTTYTYDALDNLTSVAQGPLNPRAFVYDSLSRLTSSANPEAGTTTYTYDADGNILIKTDARSITSTYAYDTLNRVTSKTYSDGTPTVWLAYDLPTEWGVNLGSSIGRLSATNAWNGAWVSGEIFAYDPMGRVTNNTQCNSSQTCSNGPLYSISYTYDLLGDITSSTDGEGVTLTNTYNAGARLTSVTSSISDSNHPPILFGYQNIAHYNAGGSLTSVTLGNNVNETRTYDARLRLTQINNGPVYGVTIPTSGGYAPNSDILAADDFINGNWTYGYDAFNRLICSNLTSNGTCANPTSGKPTYGYAYDRFGNRWQQNGPQSSQLGFDANNHIVGVTGVSYDAAGDATGDGTTTYTYDAEGRVITANNSTSGPSSYMYDAQGRRIQKTTSAGGTVNFLYDLAGHEITQTSAGLWQRGEIYAGGRHVATYYGGTTYFTHADWLGTERSRSNVSGALCESITGLPYGDAMTMSGNCVDPSPMHFTGKEHDTETGLENFGVRYDSSSMDRFMSPDPDNAGAVEGAPQTWNAYPYVANHPLNAGDPDGRDCLYFDASKTSAVVKTGDCFSDTDNGYYVDGTVDTTEFGVYNSNTGMATIQLVGGGAAKFHMSPPDATDEDRFNAAVDGVTGGGAGTGYFGSQMAAMVAGMVGGAILDEALAAAKAAQAAKTAEAAKAAVDVENLSNKIVRQMLSRGWTKQEILDTVQNGERYSVVNKATGGPATEYVSASGKFVVVDDTTKQVLQVSGPGFAPNHLAP